MKLIPSFLLFIGVFTSIPGHAIELSRRSLLKALGLGGAAVAQPAATAAALVTPLVAAPPAAPAQSIASIARSTALTFRKQAITKFYAGHERHLSKDFEFLRYVVLNHGENPSVWTKDAFLSDLGTLYSRFSRGRESLDVIRHYMAHHPSKISDEQRSLLNQIEDLLNAEKRLYPRDFDTIDQHFDIGRVTDWHLSEKPSTAVSNLIRTLIETLQVHPDFQIEFSVYFKNQLVQLEIELAEELGVEPIQVEKAIEMMSPSHRLDQLITHLGQDEAEALQQIPFDQKFVDLYLQKLESFAPDAAAKLQSLNSAFTEAMEQDPLKCLEKFQLSNSWSAMADGISWSTHGEQNLFRKNVRLSLRSEYKVLGQQQKLANAGTKNILPDHLLSSPFKFQTSVSSYDPRNNLHPIGEKERIQIARAYIKTIELLEEGIGNLELLPESNLLTSMKAALEKTVVEVTHELKTLPQRLDVLERTRKDVLKWELKNKKYGPNPLSYLSLDSSRPWVESILREDLSSNPILLETPPKLPEWASPVWLTFDIEETDETAVRLTRWLVELEKLGARPEILNLPLPSIETPPHLEAPSEAQQQPEAASDVTKETECQILLTEPQSAEVLQELAKDKDQI